MEDRYGFTSDWRVFFVGFVLLAKDILMGYVLLAWLPGIIAAVAIVLCFSTSLSILLLYRRATARSALPANRSTQPDGRD
jgi:membrane protein implicated in regulation of membrane protease activity